MTLKYYFILFIGTLAFQLYGQDIKQAPDFAMEILDGNSKMLSDYNGEVVYISFWASWCAPCITNFEKYKDIRSTLEEEGVILLNVSIDEDETKWLKAIDKLEINGINAIAKKENLYPAYQISSIPLYEIIGKNGQFLYLSDEANRDIVAQFKNWLIE